MRKNMFSIIIPTYNSEAFLDKCLKSIKDQKYPSYEIIVVDQKSTDDTVRIAKKNHTRVLSTASPKFYSPPSKSRNIGAKVSKGEFLYHLDSDMELSKNLLSEAYNIFRKDKRIGALMVYEKDKTKGFFSKCKALERRCYKGNDNIDSARIVRKEVFDKVHGYDEDISSGEDFAIQKKYKKVCKVAYCKNVAFHDLTGLTFGVIMDKKYNYGKTASMYFKKSNTTVFSHLFTEFGMYFKNYRLLIKNPFITIGMFVMKFCELFFGFLGYIRNMEKASY